MFQSFYNGLSGMFTSSKALDVLSDNIANMQTPGFKAKDSFATNLSANGKGVGSSISDIREDFSQGEVSQTGNKTDLFIDGRALFVLKNGDEFLYTRAGALAFNIDDVLVDKLSGFEVVGINENGSISNISLDGIKSIPYESTTNIVINGELTKNDDRVDVENITYIDLKGKNKKLNIVVHLEEDIWKVEVTGDKGNKIGDGIIEFDLGGSLKPGKEKISVNTTDGQSIEINFGQNGSRFGTRLLLAGASSSLQVKDVDGHQDIPFKDISIDEKGVVKLEYANGNKKDIASIGFVTVDNYELFEVKTGHLLTSKKGIPDVKTIGDGVEAKIISGSLELSNVDLAQEFGDMMVIQRSYQASSRVMTISNQLIEQLYNSTGR